MFQPRRNTPPSWPKFTYRLFDEYGDERWWTRFAWPFIRFFWWSPDWGFTNPPWWSYSDIQHAMEGGMALAESVFDPETFESVYRKRALR